jgi:hypothetical protein
MHNSIAHLIYKTKSPVLFLIFNRPDTTGIVFEEIKKVRPSRLYIAADGPRKNKENEKEICIETRNIINRIDWDCEVKTLFREDNLGCKYAISSAIDWFFENEEEGIILEDDCKPSQDFFLFCDLMLEKYHDDNRINCITGTNLQNKQKFGEASYYFSNHTCVWGWASWRRVWKKYDVELSNFDNSEVIISFKNLFPDPMIHEPWIYIFGKLKNNEIDTWDYQFAIMNFFNNTLTIVPNNNLITNIGFNENATHTFDKSNPNSNLPFGKLDAILSHPNIMMANKEADYNIFKVDFDVEEKLKIKREEERRNRNMYRIIKRRIRGFFKKNR